MHLKKKKLNIAIASALMISAFPSTSGAAALEEIVVTATKRAASAQDIPVAVTALNGESLEELNITNFDDYVQYLPNVTIQGRGPGQSEIYIRGASAEQAPIFISETNGSAPSVALYQDEQPVSFGGRNLDVYATDLERVDLERVLRQEPFASLQISRAWTTSMQVSILVFPIQPVVKTATL